MESVWEGKKVVLIFVYGLSNGAVFYFSSFPEPGFMSLLQENGEVHFKKIPLGLFFMSLSLVQNDTIGIANVVVSIYRGRS